MRSRAEQSAGVRRVSRYAASAASLQALEAFVPYPLPGVKLGLANLVTLVVLARHGAREAVETAALRVLAASLVLGGFLTPGFFLSLGGSLASAAAMASGARLCAAYPGLPLSLVGWSVLGAVAHLGVQLVLVFLLFLRHPGVWALAPWLFALAALTGWVNGMLALRVLRAPVPRGQVRAEDPIGEGDRVPPASPMRRAPAVLKVLVLLGLTVGMATIEDLRLLVAALALAPLVALLGRVPAMRLLRSLLLALPLALSLFSIPLLYSAWKGGFATGGMQGDLTQGLAAAVRLCALALYACVLTSTTTATELAAALRTLLGPLSRLRLDVERWGALLSGTLILIPRLSADLTARFRRERTAGRAKGGVLATAQALLTAVVATAVPRA